MYYPATFLPHEDGSGVYDVAFVDIPGCYSQGDNIEHALLRAGEALSLHLSSMIEDGDEIPKPSTLDEARRKEEDEAAHDGDVLPEGALFQYIIVDIVKPVKKTPPVHVSVSLKPSVLVGVDAIAEDMGLTRSGVLSLAARDFVTRNRA